MRFTPAFLDELRARVPVSAVAGRKVRLKREGREWKGLSPFSSEKTPSFFVNDQKMRWFDFSAGKDGNIFDFVMETEGLSFPEAVEKLAAEAGMALPAVTREDTIREARRATALDAMEAAAKFFEAQLRGAAGERARAYLAGRGLGEDAQRQFRIGFAPRDRFALRDHLAGKDIARDMMIEGGLLIHGEDIEVPYDRFRDRVMFPIGDRSGRIIAFGGRALDPDAPAKYLNSPETPLFHKGAGLYNHHSARKAAHDTGRVIVVEGYVDVIAMAGAGFPDTVAPLGTALTPDQCRLLWTMAQEPILCFDGDKAGQKAAARAIDTALPFLGGGRSLRFALLPTGLDPDDLARSGGEAAISAVIAGAKPLVEMLWLRERDARPLETPEQRTDLLDRLASVPQAIGSAELRKAYQADLRGRAFDYFRASRPARRGPAKRDWAGPSGSRHADPYRIGAAGPPPVSESLARSALFGSGGGVSPRIAFILTTLRDFPSLIASHAEELAALPLPGPAFDRLRHALLSLADGEEIADGGAEAAIDAAGARAAADQLAALSGPARMRTSIDAQATLDADAGLRQALTLQRRSAALHNDLRAVEADLANNPIERNFQRLRDLRAQLSNFEGMDAAYDESAASSRGR